MKSDDRAYAHFIRSVLRDKDTVKKSTGEQFRSWSYEVDCVSGLLVILLNGENGQAYNIADESSNISIRELVEMIATIGGKEVIMDVPSDAEKAGYNMVTKSVFSVKRLEGLDWLILPRNMEDKIRNSIYHT